MNKLYYVDQKQDDEIKYHKSPFSKNRVVPVKNIQRTLIGRAHC